MLKRMVLQFMIFICIVFFSFSTFASSSNENIITVSRPIFNGQELIKDNSGNIIDWTNKRTDINESNHNKQIVKGGTHTTYIVNIGDEATWEIGADGYPLPLEEFKMREKVTVKEGISQQPEVAKLINAIQSGWTIVYKVGEQYYKITGSDIKGKGRSVFSFTGKELLVTDSSDISTNEQLLTKAIGQQSLEAENNSGDTLGDKKIIYSGGGWNNQIK